ncbi:MAG: GIY-YIG nuclease family protein [Pseudomonadota bacterium]|nr:GIY-YIG nuclease family protein [Pseudomonadota bacterium]
MDLFTFLQAVNAEITPTKCKIHLAVWNGEQNPLDVYLAGDFEEWQSYQSKRNFNREYIVSLIQLPEHDTWLLAGIYESISDTWNEDHYDYTTKLVPEFESYYGRLKVSFTRSGRQSYLIAENWSESIVVKEITAQRVVVESFQGYQQTSLSKTHLDIIVKHQISDWRSALSSVSGIYLITDLATGKLYVGSATGEYGLWQRWCDYSYTGHGGNNQLYILLNDKGMTYADNFQYSILEIADTHKTKDEILARESYWKNVLASRQFGYNDN